MLGFGRFSLPSQTGQIVWKGLLHHFDDICFGKRKLLFEWFTIKIKEKPYMLIFFSLHKRLVNAQFSQHSVAFSWKMFSKSCFNLNTVLAMSFRSSLWSHQALGEVKEFPWTQGFLHCSIVLVRHALRETNQFGFCLGQDRTGRLFFKKHALRFFLHYRRYKKTLQWHRW